MSELIRPNWDEYFMEIAHVVAKRSTCVRRKVGAIGVRDKQILATGYNGAPKDMTHCTDIGCLRQQMQVPSGERHELCRAIHAEQNVIIQAALNGVSLKGATIYCTHHPCVLCAKMLINVETSKIVYKGAYPDEMASEMLREAGIEMVSFELSK